MRVNNSSLLDIVIVNYNSTDYLLPCLRSVYNSLGEIPTRVFVLDNASEDGVECVKEECGEAVLLKNSYNMGFSKAVNSGIKQGDSPYIALLNPDTLVRDGFFDSAIHYMEENTNVGIVGPKVFNPDGSAQGSARAFPTPLTALFGRSSLLTKWFPNNRITRKNVLTTRSDGITPTEVDWVSGACMVVRRKAVDDVGLMDERFFLYWEDADWCKRMWNLAWKVKYLPQTSIVHYVGGSSDKLLIRSVLEFHKSAYYLFDKYTKGPLRLVKPLVILGLAIRIFLVLFIHGIRRLPAKR